MPLQEGDHAPPFEAEDQHGERFSSGSLGGTRYVLYFYPRDETYFCTQEACGFQASLSAFNDLGVPVIGVSPDDVASHRRFAKHHGLTFRLLSDRGRSIIKAYGADGLLGRTTRVTYIVGPDGVIEAVRRHELSGKGHVEWAAERVQEARATAR